MSGPFGGAPGGIANAVDYNGFQSAAEYAHAIAPLASSVKRTNAEVTEEGSSALTSTPVAAGSLPWSSLTAHFPSLPTFGLSAAPTAAAPLARTALRTPRDADPGELPSAVRGLLAWLGEVRAGLERGGFDELLQSLCAENAVLLSAVERESTHSAELRASLRAEQQRSLALEGTVAALRADVGTLLGALSRMHSDAHFEWDGSAVLHTVSGVLAAAAAAAAGPETPATPRLLGPPPKASMQLPLQPQAAPAALQPSSASGGDALGECLVLPALTAERIASPESHTELSAALQSRQVAACVSPRSVTGAVSPALQILQGSIGPQSATDPPALSPSYSAAAASAISPSVLPSSPPGVPIARHEQALSPVNFRATQPAGSSSNSNASGVAGGALSGLSALLRFTGSGPAEGHHGDPHLTPQAAAAKAAALMGIPAPTAKPLSAAATAAAAAAATTPQPPVAADAAMTTPAATAAGPLTLRAFSTTGFGLLSSATSGVAAALGYAKDSLAVPPPTQVAATDAAGAMLSPASTPLVTQHASAVGTTSTPASALPASSNAATPDATALVSAAPPSGAKLPPPAAAGPQGDDGASITTTAGGVYATVSWLMGYPTQAGVGGPSATASASAPAQQVHSSSSGGGAAPTPARSLRSALHALVAEARGAVAAAAAAAAAASVKEEAGAEGQGDSEADHDAASLGPDAAGTAQPAGHTRLRAHSHSHSHHHHHHSVHLSRKSGVGAAVHALGSGAEAAHGSGSARTAAAWESWLTVRGMLAAVLAEVDELVAREYFAGTAAHATPLPVDLARRLQLSDVTIAALAAVRADAAASRAQEGADPASDPLASESTDAGGAPEDQQHAAVTDAPVISPTDPPAAVSSVSDPGRRSSQGQLDGTGSAEGASGIPFGILPVPRASTAPVGRGLRILTLDGGGIRGLLMLECLKRIEADTGRRICDLFDLVCGTSTGGFLSLCLTQRMTLEEIASAYERIRSSFVSQSALVSELKRFTVGASHSSSIADAVAKGTFGSTRMDEMPAAPKVFVVCAAADHFPSQPYLFRSYDLTAEAKARAFFMGTSNLYTYEAARATTAAPTYYQPVAVGGQRMADGAIIANNPTLIAICEAQLLWPGVPIDVVLSLGTGTQVPRPGLPSSVMAWVKTTIDLAMNSFVAHKIAATLLGDRYFRLDPDGLGDIDLSEMRADILGHMLEDGRRYIQRSAPVFKRLRDALVDHSARSKPQLGGPLRTIRVAMTANRHGAPLEAGASGDEAANDASAALSAGLTT